MKTNPLSRLDPDYSLDALGRRSRSQQRGVDPAENGFGPFLNHFPAGEGVFHQNLAPQDFKQRRRVRYDLRACGRAFAALRN